MALVARFATWGSMRWYLASAGSTFSTCVAKPNDDNNSNYNNDHATTNQSY